MKKILFVDDEKDILEIYKQLLADTEYEVYVASDGYEALKIIEHHIIPLMFFDLNMPKMSGLELCEKIRESNSISIINAITGYSSLFQLVEVRNAGFDDYFKKPVEVERLLKVIDDCYEKIDRWNIN